MTVAMQACREDAKPGTEQRPLRMERTLPREYQSTKVRFNEPKPLVSAARDFGEDIGGVGVAKAVGFINSQARFVSKFRQCAR